VTVLGRLLIAAFVLLFLVALVSAVWNLCDWPPPRLVLKYGFPHTGGPTGRTMIIEGVEFVELKPGYFRMGAHIGCVRDGPLDRLLHSLGRTSSGPPPHHTGLNCPLRWQEVAVTIWVGAAPIQQRLYSRFLRVTEPPDLSTQSRQPVVDVSWGDAVAFSRWFSLRHSVEARLPTDGEWEYAARAGQDVPENERYVGRPEGQGPCVPLDVASMSVQNGWGLSGMATNGIREWCSDLFTPMPGEYAGNPPFRVTRGATWGNSPACSSMFMRVPQSELSRNELIGFRLVIGR
jgi:formylglycine-generating enzyme required for sulfatase activity